MKFTNSPLVSYTKISPFKTVNRNHSIDTITIHCFVAQVTAQRGAEVFQTSGASCNYVVAKDGKIALVVEEKDRSWCSSNPDNDNRAVTIEVASDNFEPYKVTPEALDSLIKLCADICQRNGIKELKWKGDKSLIGKIDKQNMTVHRWFAAKKCPGDYLYNLHPYIATEVNKLLIKATAETTKEETIKYKYRVQAGSFTKTENANNMLQKILKLGLPAVVNKGDKYYKVSAGDFKTKAEAEKAMKLLKDNKIDCYISNI